MTPAKSGESPDGFCCISHSLSSLGVSLPWMVVSPFVPARGAVPLSSCGDQENSKGYRGMEISVILILPMTSLSWQAGCEQSMGLNTLRVQRREMFL